MITINGPLIQCSTLLNIYREPYNNNITMLSTDATRWKQPYF